MVVANFYSKDVRDINLPKNAITNVKVKPPSGHDPKILFKVFSTVSFTEHTPSANQSNVKKK